MGRGECNPSFIMENASWMFFPSNAFQRSEQWVFRMHLISTGLLTIEREMLCMTSQERIGFASSGVWLTLSGEAQTLTWHKWMVNMACERELWTFICVLAVVRDRAPSFRHCIIWITKNNYEWRHWAANVPTWMSYLGLGGHSACGHTHGVDAPVGILMDPDVRFLLPIPHWVKQIQNFLVI